MFGILYLLLASFIGLQVLRRFLPRLMTLLETTSLGGTPLPVGNWMITAPASFLIGTLLMTWFTYLAAYLFAQTDNPMLYGNLVSFNAASALALYLINRRKAAYQVYFRTCRTSFAPKALAFLRQHPWEVLYTGIALAISFWLMIFTLQVKDNNILIGGWTYSDLGPHISMIRSFSQGANFPTQFPYYSNDGIHYHFMFNFLAGNLEFLGLRLDYAFNTVTALSMTAMLMLLYAFIVIMTGNRPTAFITLVLFLFRSSFAVVYYMQDNFFKYAGDIGLPPLGDLLCKIITIKEWIGKTLYEYWGQWSMPHEFVNQRHNPFAIAMLLLTLLYVFPLFTRMMQQLPPLRENGRWNIKPWLDAFLTSTGNWQALTWTGCITMGILLGLICFWNGPMLISTLMILFFLALASRHRMEFLTIAGISVLLCVMQDRFFSAGGHGSSFTPKIVFGYLAPGPDFNTVLGYYLEVFGILPFVILLGTLFLPKGGKWLTFIFLVPVIAATLVQFSLEMMNNQKFVFVSIILANIVAANLLYQLWKSRNILKAAVSVLLFVCLTMTGVVDAFSFYNKNVGRYVCPENTDLITWIHKYTMPKAVFLTTQDVFNQVLQSGHRVFLGWGWYPTISGHDVSYRQTVYNEIYGATDPDTLLQLVKDNKIDYILVNNVIRSAQGFHFSEDVFNKHFVAVYRDPEGAVVYAPQQ